MAKFKENIVVKTFEKESEAYQSFTELKSAIVDDRFLVSQAAIVKRENGEVVVKDDFITGLRAGDDTLKGGLIGGLIGLLGGPLGALLGAGAGAMIGQVKDAGDVIKDLTIADAVSECIEEGVTALIILADEKGDAALNEKLNAFAGAVTRISAAEAEKEIDRIDRAQSRIEEQEWKKDIKALKDYYNIKVDENVLIINYKNESDAYKAFSELTQDSVNDYYFISQAAIVKKENGQYIIKDSDERLEKSVNDTLKGGLIGGLIGLLGGPLASFLGSQIGSAIGSFADAGEALRDFNLVDYVYEAIPEGATVIVLQADEKGSDALDKKLNEYDVTISRVSVPELVKGIELLEKEKEKEAESD